MSGLSNWWDEFSRVEADDAGDDYVGELWRDTARRGERLDDAVLSSAWARGRTKKENPEAVVFDLLEIREAVRSLLKVHGIPRGTEIRLAMLGSTGAGCASFRDIDNFKGPYLMLDKAIYAQADSASVMDVYCGVALHEASHLNHTREMFRRLKAGELKGTRAMLEGLLEDERIENEVRKESPGFGPYLDALKRALFEKKEFGSALTNWDALPDVDKAMAIVFGTIRCPHTLTDEMRAWKTLTGLCVFEELRKVLPNVPRTEAEVEEYGGRVFRLWQQIRKDYDDAKAADEKALKEMADKLREMMGDPEAGSDAGSESGGDDAGDSDAGDSDAGSGESGSDAGDDAGDAGDAGDDAGSDASGSGGDGSDASGDASGSGGAGGSSALEEVIQRIDRQRDADIDDAADSKKLADADRKESDAASEAASEGGDSVEGVSEAAKSDRLDELDAASENLEDAKADRDDVMRGRVERFSPMDVEHMMDRLDKVTDALDADESSEMAKAEEEKIEFADSWKAPGTRGGSDDRRTVIIHPKVDAATRRRYKEFHAMVRGQVAAMRNVFRFRLGTRVIQERELVEGRMDRRMLGRAPLSNRIFKRSHKRTDRGIAVCLLLDESGSMGYADASHPNQAATKALQCGLLIAEALRSVPGVELEVYSYASCGAGSRDCLIKYLYGKENPNFESICGYHHGAQNYDHMAIRTAGELFTRNTVNDNRLMIVLSDGEPAGNGYGGESARKATKYEVDALRKRGMQVMQVAIESFDSASMFGKDVVQFLDLKSLTNQMRKLVVRVIKNVTNG